ncbi:unnamed protein product [Dibothriocephalus latus]|uniref:Uncharacterized protein n=1 Tax=Dibothriocephalus latus TaxID=60516 RepID=A0A3P7Q3K9_DIBLA|nr:unnamed protein product [Dibothriocephalus latus]
MADCILVPTVIVGLAREVACCFIFFSPLGFSLTGSHAANRSVLIKATTERSTSSTTQPRRPTPGSSSALDQRRLMSGIKRRSISNSDRDPKRAHTGSSEPNNLVEEVEGTPKVAETAVTGTKPVEARVLAGFLPGLDAYSGSCSDSSSDSSTDVEDAAQTLDVIAMTRTKSSSSGGE